MRKLVKNMPNACKEFEEDIVLHYYGEGSAAELKRVEEHIALCAPCRKFSDDLRRLLPQATQTEELPQSFWDDYRREVMHKIAEQEERRSWWRDLFAPMQSWAVPAFAGAMVLALGITFTLDKIAWNPAGEPQPLPIPQEILSDPNSVEFFKSLDLVEALRKLEEIEGSKSDPKAPSGAQTI